MNTMTALVQFPMLNLAKYRTGDGDNFLGSYTLTEVMSKYAPNTKVGTHPERFVDQASLGLTADRILLYRGIAVW